MSIFWTSLDLFESEMGGVADVRTLFTHPRTDADVTLREVAHASGRKLMRPSNVINERWF